VVLLGLIFPLLRGPAHRAEVTDSAKPASSSTGDAKRQVVRIVSSEELILKYTPKLGKLAQSVLNLRLPDYQSRALFAEKVDVSGRAAAAARPDGTFGSLCAGLSHWPHSPKHQTIAANSLELWRPALADVDYFEHAKFYFISAKFINDEATRWRSNVGFSGLAKIMDGRWRSYSGKMTLVWTKTGQGDDAAWQIVEWRTKKLAAQQSDRPLFVEVLDTALPEAKSLARARESIQDQLIVRAVKEKDFKPPTKYFVNYAYDRHPGVAVVDINGDGWDDLYAMDQWGRNLLLRNRGDGTFEEVAAEYGLDLSDHCSCAIFADFDNDGDSDLFLGRTLERSRYFVNDGGRFVDQSDARVAGELPYLVSSIAAADYNGDGLLDVYLSTYADDTIDKDIIFQGGIDALYASDSRVRLLAEFLPAEQAEELFRRHTKSRMFTSQVGPPNLLLVNRGGRFEVSPAAESLRVWRNTYQSTWGDFDNDGDPDLYVANDFSPNHLFRNDRGTFVDVTEQTQTADIGFGMGAAWGDYDNDGRQDLYVSNMASKAGRRIAGGMRNLVDPAFEKMAGGNTLFRNQADHFAKVSGLEPPALTVEWAGWSWGGQFIDIDNNGYLDLYVTSGYYSAPPEIAAQVDL